MWTIILVVLLVLAYYGVTESTKSSRFLRYLIHYPFRIVVTFAVVAFFGAAFMIIFYGPMMLIINGLFSLDYGIFSDNFDSQRVVNFHAKWYWLFVFGLTSLILIKNFIDTEKEQNKK